MNTDEPNLTGLYVLLGACALGALGFVWIQTKKTGPEVVYTVPLQERFNSDSLKMRGDYRPPPPSAAPLPEMPAVEPASTEPTSQPDEATTNPSTLPAEAPSLAQ